MAADGVRNIEVDLVITYLASDPEEVPALVERYRVRERGHSGRRASIDRGRCADNHPAGGRRNANERQPRILVRSGAPYADVGVLDWLLGKRIVANERVPRPHLVQQV